VEGAQSADKRTMVKEEERVEGGGVGKRGNSGGQEGRGDGTADAPRHSGEAGCGDKKSQSAHVRAVLGMLPWGSGGGGGGKGGGGGGGGRPSSSSSSTWYVTWPTTCSFLPMVGSLGT